jgi:hypothetical protein
MQKTTPPITSDIITVSAKSQKYRYVDVIPTLAKLQISSRGRVKQERTG